VLTKEKILTIARKRKRIVTNNIASSFSVSRQYANSLIGELVAEGKLIKLGITRRSFYALPKYAAKYQRAQIISYTRLLKNRGLEEYKVLVEAKGKLPVFARLSENVQSIFDYAFSEMLNNAIEHSKSKRIRIKVEIQNKHLLFIIRDFGVGVFKSIVQQKHLDNELEAIQELLKGKITTMPHTHTGEGIFFTSRVADNFALKSFNYELIFDNEISDIFVHKLKRVKRGTEVIFRISRNTKRHLLDIFNKYSNIDDKSDYGFDKTEILVKLYSTGGIHFSRSQARRILSGLEKFRVILFDYDKVPMIGQAFADEIYRVFHQKYPEIRLEAVNMNEAVKFMIERAKTEARRIKNIP
jgi:anti-sigma regulatory factor (Ser/Thr protein kinase)